jgi:dihydropteroate synthase
MASEAVEGIRLWLQVLDPGIGFAKDVDSDLSLLKHLSGKFRQLLQQDYPILIGPSRKSFLGHITGETDPSQRDYGTAAACAAAVLVRAARDNLIQDKNSGDGVVTTTTQPTIIRVHNVKGLKQAIQVIDAINSAT